MPAPRPDQPARLHPKRPHRAGTIVLAGLVAMLTTGCGVASSGNASGIDQLPAANADSTRSSESTAHVAADIADRLTDEPTDSLRPSDLDQLEPVRDPDGPEHAAVAVILDGLAGEGLLVTSIRTEQVAADGQHATVTVTVAHSSGRGHPTQSRYELDLAHTGDGWNLTGHREQR